MSVKENRFIRIEDWNGNVYIPESSSGSGGSTSGDIIDSDSAGTDPKNPTYTEGSTTSDPTANGGTAIVITSGNTRKKLFVTNLPNVPFGDISINMRIKSSMSKGDTQLLEVNTYFVDVSGEEESVQPLDSKRFTADSFPKPNEYTNLSMVTNFKGISTGNSLLRVEVIVLPDTGATFYLDRLAVAMEMKSQPSENEKIHVEGSTVIVP